MEKGEMKNAIRTIIEKNYKGTRIGMADLDLSSDCDYLTMKVSGMKERNMPFAAGRILRRFPEIRFVHFTGGWTEHVYSRETLKWMGH